MKLTGLSAIHVNNNSTLVFRENNALKMGGTIYVESPNRHGSSTCFIKKMKGTKKQPNFIFSNNTASFEEHDNKTNAIFSSTILSCLNVCNESNLTMTKALESIGRFHFDESSRGQKQLISTPHHFSKNVTSKEEDNFCTIFVENSIIFTKREQILQKIDNHKTDIFQKVSVIPGKKFDTSLKLIDELCEEVPFHVSVQVVESTNGSMYINNSLITSNNLEVYGDPRDRGTLRFSAIGVRKDVTLSVQLDNCPPGYIHQIMSCVCSLNTEWHYPGIERCDKLKYKAYAKYGYWLGYVHNQTTQETLASAICPRGFCTIKNHTEYPLPPEAINDLSLYVCNNRTGIICGNCNKNRTSHYHSSSFSCKSVHWCHFGWLFYMLSEIFPVTVMFLIVIYFNISFTSGALNGVIFFIQIINTLKVDGENFIQFSETVARFSRIHKILYRMFILKFFALEELSFCLWEGATALDMLAFRYVTIVYSLLLVVITVVILRKCTCRFGKGKDQMTKTSLNLKHSILNGLSAFLVMSYSECTQVTLMILTTGTLTVGPVDKSDIASYEYKYVSFYNGNYEYMSPQHLKYALPAIAFLLTLVTLPPLLLIVYPLCYKLFAWLRIDESKCLKIVCKILPLEKIKPLFDSIQGEFKDQYRFFAGLYFIYRLSTSLTFAFASALKTYYSATCIQLAIILVLHAICWPYKKKWHNVLDALLFTNLALINIITYFNYVSDDDKSSLDTLTGLQCGLILLPLVYLVVYTAYNIVKKIKEKMFPCSSQENVQTNDDNSNNVLELIDTRNFDNSEEGPIDYVAFQEKLL